MTGISKSLREIDNILGHIPGINDEGDVVGILLALRDCWPSVRAALEERERGLFRLGEFRLHSGAPSDWIIDCRAFTEGDLGALALIGARLAGPFGEVAGVPTGGLRFADALRPYATSGAPRLVADDVLTTGWSMDEHRQGPNDKGLVIFARAEPPPWVKCIWRLSR